MHAAHTSKKQTVKYILRNASTMSAMRTEACGSMYATMEFNIQSKVLLSDSKIAAKRHILLSLRILNFPDTRFSKMKANMVTLLNNPY